VGHTVGAEGGAEGMPVYHATGSSDGLAEGSRVFWG
jgi:hypothetical protein